ncbi:shikimate dehydrogenase [Bifidobacterium pseudolongum subsp. pseudolongum]|uniref:shikimate dehydrogenase n=1 Tax=Bifidobacterium pseudolongum TaxID=1694 RepID=UPI00101FFC8D|nr:shikimate dehydrogenase [Bifidobacterium pseudolongum]RYQ49845.1 shikimate dehydrogenase [Bifidobacterium pseudolongum subsp. pseudolongum]
MPFEHHTPHRHCAVLGQPIAHSLSPVLHTAAYRAMGLDDWDYRSIEVGQDDLEPFLDSLDDTWAGLSLTMPLKRTIQPYGEPSNLWARELGVANTVVFDGTGHNRALKLFNTDVYGIARAFEEAGNRQTQTGTAAHAHRTAVILGNGNTATSALAACAMMGDVSDVVVAARHPDRNPGLAACGERHGMSVRLVPLADCIPDLAAADVAVNTIPAHGADVVAQALLDASVDVHGMLLDVVYDPRPTALMRAWRKRGGISIGGEEMLLYQAVAQVLLMTGHAQSEDFDHCSTRTQDRTLETAMRAALEEAL